MRGEYTLAARIAPARPELPPRARRILISHQGRACPLGNYLRVRGEYAGLTAVSKIKAELPPRARRIRVHAVRDAHINGTTSACAENTRPRRRYPQRKRNYLRVRGEYYLYKPVFWEHGELPPRARRIRTLSDAAHSAMGTTSACAENTRIAGFIKRHSWNYLRVRGEYAGRCRPRGNHQELPPRARRIP